MADAVVSEDRDAQTLAVVEEFVAATNRTSNSTPTAVLASNEPSISTQRQKPSSGTCDETRRHRLSGRATPRPRCDPGRRRRR